MVSSSHPQGSLGGADDLKTTTGRRPVPDPHDTLTQQIVRTRGDAAQSPSFPILRYGTIIGPPFSQPGSCVIGTVRDAFIDKGDGRLSCAGWRGDHDDKCGPPRVLSSNAAVRLQAIAYRTEYANPVRTRHDPATPDSFISGERVSGGRLGSEPGQRAADQNGDAGLARGERTQGLVGNAPPVDVSREVGTDQVDPLAGGPLGLSLGVVGRRPRAHLPLHVPERSSSRCDRRRQRGRPER
jgi:hypothetical protein